MGNRFKLGDIIKHFSKDYTFIISEICCEDGTYKIIGAEGACDGISTWLTRPEIYVKIGNIFEKEKVNGKID